MSKLLSLGVLVVLAACSSDDRSVGNGPGEADGAGRSEDGQSSEAAPIDKAVPQDAGQATRERPSAEANVPPENPSQN